MFAFLVGWGVFWLLIWLFVLVIGLVTKEDTDNLIGMGFVGAVVSIAYLIACAVGKLVGG